MQEELCKFYVYEWYDLDTGEVFYVGKGCGKRYSDIRHRNQEFLNYFATHNTEVRIILDNLTEQEAFIEEKKITDEYKKQNQCKCNLAEAGHGGLEVVWTPELREYWSKNNPMKSEEQRQRMREKNPMYNKEVAQKSGKAHKRAVIIEGKEFEGAIDAATYYGVSQSTISSWCQLGKSPDGKECRYKDGLKKPSRQGHPVIVDGIYYNSGTEAALAVGLKPVTLNKSLREGRKICMGHTCEYANQQPSQ